MTLILSPARQRLIALALGIITLVLIFLLVIVPIWSSIAIQEDRIAMLRRQAHKLEALAAAAPDYEEAAKKISSNADVSALTFAASQPSVGVADLQAALNKIFSAAGVTVNTSQALPETTGDGLTKIAVQTNLELDLAALVRALHAVATARPLLKIEKFTIHEPDGEWVKPPGSNTPNRLIVDMVVSAQMRRT